MQALHLISVVSGMRLDGMKQLLSAWNKKGEQAWVSVFQA